MTADQLYTTYLRRFGTRLNEQGAGMFGAGVMLVHAIEAANSLDTDAVLAQLSSIRLKTLYGTVSFDPATHMNRGTALVGQLGPNSSTSRTLPTRPALVYPLVADGAVAIATAPMHFPTPSWATRECIFSHRCGQYGLCMSDGSCKCDADRTGPGCTIRRRDSCTAAAYQVSNASVSACASGTRTVAIAAIAGSGDGCPHLDPGVIGCRYSSWEELSIVLAPVPSQGPEPCVPLLRL